MENKIDARVEIIDKIIKTNKNIEKLKESYEDAIQLGEKNGIANVLKANIEIYEEELKNLEEDRIKIGEQLKEKKNMYEKRNETILEGLHKTKEQIELFSYLNEFDEEKGIAEKNEDGEYIAGSIQANREKKLQELNEKFAKLDQVYDKNYDKNIEYIKEIEKTLKLLGIEEELAEENEKEEQKEDEKIEENEETKTGKKDEKSTNDKIKELNDKKKEYEAENEIYKEKIEKLQKEEKELTDIAQKNMISTDNETQKNQTNLLRNILRIRQDIKFYKTKIEQNNKQIEKINSEIEKLEIIEKGKQILDDISTDYKNIHIKSETKFGRNQKVKLKQDQKDSVNESKDETKEKDNTETKNEESKQPSNENVLAELTEEELNALLSPKENIFKNIFKNAKNSISNFFNNIKLGFKALTGKTKLIEEAKQMDFNKTERIGSEILDNMKSDYKNIHFNVEPLSVEQLKNKNNIDRKAETLYREDEEIPKEQLEGLENIGHDGLIEIKTEKEENKPRLDIQIFDNRDGHIEKTAMQKQKEHEETSEKQKKYDDLFDRMFEAAKEK